MLFFWETLIGNAINDNPLPPALLGTTPIPPSPDNPRRIHVNLSRYGVVATTP